MPKSISSEIAMSTPRFQTLPAEVKQAILSAIPDIPSLISAALTCSPLYHTFKDAESLITTSVLLNQIDKDVLPEAILALESSKISPVTKPEVEDFARQQLRVRNAAPLRWTVSDALPLSKFHEAVHFFAEDFTKRALSKTTVSYAPSRNEMNRIERTLYRFEIYRNMYSQVHHLCSVDEQKAIFFDRFSYWENEQYVFSRSRGSKLQMFQTLTSGRGWLAFRHISSKR
jgi:hypothetical protein